MKGTKPLHDVQQLNTALDAVQQRQLFTPTETHQLLRMSRAWLWAEWKAGRGPAWIRLGNRRRVSAEALRNFIAESQQAGST